MPSNVVLSGDDHREWGNLQGVILAITNPAGETDSIALN